MEVLKNVKTKHVFVYLFRIEMVIEFNIAKLHLIIYYLRTNLRDNCCILEDKSICIICNIFKDCNSYRLGIKKFLEVDNFYTVGISSSDLQIYKCATLSNEVSYITLNKVSAKGYRMPFWNNTDESDSDDSTVLNTSRYYIVIAIMHNEVL